MVNQLEGINTLSLRRWSRMQTLQAFSAISAQRLADFLKAVAQVLLDVFGATAVAISFQINDDSYKVVVAIGEAMGQGWSVHLSDGICGQVLRERRPVHIKDTSYRQRLDSQLPASKCLMAAPIEHVKQNGAIAIRHPQANIWDEEDLDMLEAIGRLIAVESKHFFRRAQTKAKSQTRNRHNSHAVHS